ncbi:MAG: type II/IV secretion system protein [Candidatus Taylorbacteria bacterium]|nr:type II/IV secretion system protein [Candidatus Taylorbacteria bacterium]
MADIISVSQTSGDIFTALEKYGVLERDYMDARGEYFGMPFRDLENKEIAYSVLNYIPEESAKFYKILPIGVVDNVLEIGVVNPEDAETQNALTFISSRVSMPIRAHLIRLKDFERLVSTYRGLTGEVHKALGELQGEIVQKASPVEEAKEETRIVEQAPVTKIIATILHYATEGAGSDIHIEPMGDKTRVRFRVDGVLATSLVLPSNVHEALIARIKILSNLRLDEKRKPQDGRFSAKIDGKKIDFRVSTLPVYYGEKVVMRILDTARGVRDLADMGLSPEGLVKVKAAIERPFGMVLISGPTGSGKSTTLYSMMKQLDFETDNIMSLEDPVEYNIPGMNQAQIKPEIGFSFATGLRTSLRQDPDVIMVGEIRDKETAQLAVQAALTGHLVLSTIHTNNAIGVIPRLIDMGVDPFLIAPTLIMAVAQRLVSLIHKPGAPLPVEGSIEMMINKSFSDLPEQFRKKIQIPKTVYEAVPSPDCPKGTRGRTAVFEILEMNKELEQVILKNPTDAEIMKVARKNGMLTMHEDALLKAFEGQIPFSEVNKI